MQQHSISKPLLSFPGLITLFCRMIEVHLHNYYPRCLDKKKYEDFAQQYCMARHVRRQSRTTVSPWVPQQNQDENLSFDDLNHNLQTYFPH